MNLDTISASELCEIAIENDIKCIVYEKDKTLNCDFETYGYEYLGESVVIILLYIIMEIFSIKNN